MFASLFVAMGAVAQESSDVGVWVIGSRWSRSESENIHTLARFDEQTGYGISFNHFWTERFSTELSAQRFGADAVVHHFSVEGEPFVDSGEIEVRSLIAMAQWHTNRSGRFAPYVGAGIARMAARFEIEENPVILPGQLTTDSYDFGTGLATVVAGGVNVRLAERVLFAGEVKYIPWSADRIVIDPVLFSAGVKVRF
jgi:outer membrane protein W